jgi:hypothetical protein
LAGWPLDHDQVTDFSGNAAAAASAAVSAAVRIHSAIAPPDIFLVYLTSSHP